MRTLGWLVALVLNAAVAVVFAPSVADTNAPASARTIGALVVLLFAAIVGVLLAARMGHLPSWGGRAMRVLVLCVPAAWFLGSLDRGIVSSQEVLSIVVVSVLAYGTWRAFKLFASEA
jgi:hypothetical protein